MSNPALSDLRDLHDWLRGQIDGYDESRGHDTEVSGYIDVVERTMDAERKLEAAQRELSRVTAERDAAGAFIRILGEECARVGLPSGDRTVTLANVRRVLREHAYAARGKP